MISKITSKVIIEPLVDTASEFERRYGKEIEWKANRTPRGHLKNLLDWLVTDPSMTVFCVTVTFKNLRVIEADAGYRKATEYEYKKRVLTKVKKRLTRVRWAWDKVIPFEDFFQYEYEQGSYFKPVPRGNSPHHIHGLLPIDNRHLDRVYDFDLNCLDKRLEKDLRSLGTLSTLKIEPLREEEKAAWLTYILKGKSAMDFNL